MPNTRVIIIGLDGMRKRIIELLEKEFTIIRNTELRDRTKLRIKPK